MKKYIEREAAVSMAHGYCHTTDGRCCGPDDVVELYEELKAIPAADVVDVRHGRWIPVTNGRGGSECNQCHAYAPSYQSGAEYNSPYCPNCGAKMDGGTDDA